MGYTAVVLLLLCVITPSNGQAPSPPSYSTTLETTLRNSLLASYEAQQRPEQTVHVQVTLNLLTINGLNIKEQTLSTSGYFSMEWSDTRLAWVNDTSYSNVNFLFSNENYIWRPAVVVENSVSSLEVINDEHTLMRINQNGRVSWTPGGIFLTSCDADVTYYPLDRQTCQLSLSTWAYTSNEVDLEMPNSDAPVDMTYYTENGEWEIISRSAYAEATTRQSQSFSRIHFSLTLQRRPLFHILNTICPVLLLASLIVFVFKLPPECGERVGLCLTVLLAYAVYLTLISDNIPQTSLSASILSTYLAIILMFSTLSVILTILVLGLYFSQEDEDVPNWLQEVTNKFLVPVSCWKRTCCNRRTKVTPDLEETHTNKPTASAHDLKKTDVRLTFANSAKSFERNGYAPHKKPILEKRPTVSSIASEEEDPTYTWKEIALMCDQIFFYCFVCLISLTTIVCFSLLVSEYNNR